MKFNLLRLKKISKEYRLKIFQKFYEIKEGHPGSVFSIIDILVVLFKQKFIRIKNKKIFDIIIISKGHATSALYPILADEGVLNKREWINWGKTKSVLRIFGNTNIPGIQATTGSLGHGVGLGCGYAKSFKLKKKKNKVFVLISEGELYEGSTWEAMLFANHHKLDNLNIIVDVNNLIILGKTKQCLNLNPIRKKFTSFGFNVEECNGHDFKALHKVFSSLKRNGKPNCVIANTIKGKGISFMENDPKWHYWQDMNYNQYKIAENELKK